MNGDYYKGRFVNSLKEGPGVYVFKDGNIFEGIFEGDVFLREE